MKTLKLAVPFAALLVLAACGTSQPGRFIAGTGVGAAGGAGTGALIGLIGGPAAPFTVPVGAAIGAATGAALGATVSAATGPDTINLGSPPPALGR